MCEIARCLAKNLLFVRENEDSMNVSCPYTFIYGYAHMCTCPTRYSLYEQEKQKKHKKEKKQ